MLDDFDHDDPMPFVPNEPVPSFTYRAHTGVSTCENGHTYSHPTRWDPLEYVNRTPCPHCERDEWAEKNADAREALKAWHTRAPIREARVRQRESAARYQNEAQF